MTEEISGVEHRTVFPKYKVVRNVDGRYYSAIATGVFETEYSIDSFVLPHLFPGVSSLFFYDYLPTALEFMWADEHIEELSEGGYRWKEPFELWEVEVMNPRRPRYVSAYVEDELMHAVWDAVSRGDVPEEVRLLDEDQREAFWVAEAVKLGHPVDEEVWQLEFAKLLTNGLLHRL